ncbi:glutamate receptor ionotropic, delta-2 [Athalia rosae]|uniref:glutamate receptor ionotropic, delta-2 n=1 Tax=Athalia rosae TaxID=37344 RepID=UPI002033F6A1|nr:glutamate receptor ionotropic, delta-2 [Athalia rosae]
MYSSITRTLFVVGIFGLSAATKSAFNSSGDSIVENYLTEFMNDLNEFAFDKIDLRCAVVIGNRGSYLQVTRTIFEHTPHLIADEPSGIPKWTCFGPSSVSFIFVDGMTFAGIETILAKYPKSFGSSVLLLLSAAPRITDLWILNYLQNLDRQGFKNVAIGQLDGKAMKFYRLELGKKCRREVILKNRWTSGRGFSSSKPIIGRNKGKLNEMGCPLVVSTMHLPPSMRLSRDPSTGRHSISGGSEGNLILTLADYFNFVPVVRVPSVRSKWSLGRNGTAFGVLGAVSREAANIGIGQILETPERRDIVDFTASYQTECMVWTVPLKFRLPDFSTMIDEFQLETWFILFLIFLVCSALVHLTARLNVDGDRRSLTSNVFDVIAMTMSLPISRHQSGLTGRLLFICYLQYVRVISTAYSSSLASILTTMNPQPEILTEEDIVAAGLVTGGTENSRQLLVDQIDPNSWRAYLLNEYRQLNSTKEALARITDKQDLAYLRHKSAIDYYATKLILQGKKPEFYTLNECVVEFGSTIVAHKGSPYIKPFNYVITQLHESGIYEHWKYPYAPRKLFSRQPALDHDWGWERLSVVFHFYLTCLVPAVLSFFVEQGASKIRKNRQSVG